MNRMPMGGPPRGRGPEKPAETYSGIVEMVYLTPENTEIYKTKNGFVCMKAFLPPLRKDDLDEGPEKPDESKPIWQDLGRVIFHRAFPFDCPDEFISVLNNEGREYGVIRNLADFDSERADIIRRELERKYFMPEIKKILSLKERFGYSYWEVETDRGRLSFAIRDTFRNILKISESRIVISDVDGNRYNINDVAALDGASYRKIELYL